MTIDAGRLDEIFRDSLFRDEEIQTLGHDPNLTVEHYMEMPAEDRPFIAVPGLVHDVAFNPERLATHHAEVQAMLEELPDEFRLSVGGGWSFLNVCMTKDGVLWGEHVNCEQLCLMAIGLGLARWAAPREFWRYLPQGMPYLTYMDKVTT